MRGCGEGKHQDTWVGKGPHIYTTQTFAFPGITAAEQSLATLWLFLYLLQQHYSPSGPDGPRPSDGSVAQPPGSAECNDCMQTPGGVCQFQALHSLSVYPQRDRIKEQSQESTSAELISFSQSNTLLTESDYCLGTIRILPAVSHGVCVNLF